MFIKLHKTAIHAVINDTTAA